MKQIQIPTTKAQKRFEDLATTLLKTAALDEYREQVEDRHYIAISNNAMKTKEPMYIDTPTGKPKQCGYVITGKTEFQDDFGNWTSQYIDLWVSVLTVIDTDFEEVTA